MKMIVHNKVMGTNSFYDVPKIKKIEFLNYKEVLNSSVRDPLNCYDENEVYVLITFKNRDHLLLASSNFTFSFCFN